MPKKASKPAKHKPLHKQVKKVLGKVKALVRPAKPVKARRQKKPEQDTGIYEETTITCPGCGRVAKVIMIAGVDKEGLICQRCAKGEVELEDMDF